ncbi:MAG: ribonuclease HI family protein [Candidatus Omnitrophota bacterium]|nr:ribonuclease HI family protein [Candidatus Omnitrophota bacterium]MBU2528857.1 ribonuclease HI family protein [bacterium]MBU3929930.1 ribonuclease HI family protein [bacterium]MBU4122654.1 ribonuclease HI family protein [bacterium]
MVKDEEIFAFLAEKQSFAKLYQKYKTLKPSRVKNMLIAASKKISSGGQSLGATGVVECFVDGAAAPNPGPAGAGAVLSRDSRVIAEVSRYLGIKTNNQAEYSALILALDEAAKIKEDFSSLRVYSDSLLMVNQINGLWRVKDAEIAALLFQVKNKIEIIKSKKNASLSFTHIARSKNKTADALSVLAIKSKN